MNIKRTRRTVLLTAFSIIFATICMGSTPLRADEFGKADYEIDSSRDTRYYIQKEIVDPHVVQRTPIFDDTTFLQLKDSDQLVKGKRWIRPSFGKGVRDAKLEVEKNESYFLSAAGKYYYLGPVYENEDKLILREGYLSLLFDWEVTIANAQVIHKIEQVRSVEPIVSERFEELKSALHKGFPESAYKDGEVKIEAPRLDGEGKARRAIFQGITFNAYQNKIMKYQFEVGNETYIERRINLITGPRPVSRSEFQDPGPQQVFPPGAKVSNQPYIGPKILPAKAAKARAAYNRALDFHEIVNRFLVQPHEVYQSRANDE